MLHSLSHRELLQPVLQLVDLLLKPGHLDINVGLLQGGDVFDLGSAGVDSGLDTVPGVEAGQELDHALLLGQFVNVPLGLPVGLVDGGLDADQGLNQFITVLHQNRNVDLIGQRFGDAVVGLDVDLGLRQPTNQAVLDLQVRSRLIPDSHCRTSP